ncbi:response regulator [Paenibacillus beijingensis]|uniref:AraC family transcriptional regulator n=1 Tax=Paenibacillus beijingensis TaxID=1126833 RepID=A0A0D5NH72_9BACL|nr:response regulator [Paenibacillus beijingensis]AJY74263.1 hypothetical protein VN24_06315 [Paenibacillus beijingensis]
MYKLLIVDDEEEIREGLADMIDWSSLGFLVAGTFQDGKDAIYYLQEHEVDAILTDIKMTFASGLEIARYVAEHKLNAKVVLLSGFQEFVLAQEAMKYNVTHYLLKPTDLDEVSATFQKIYRQLEEEKKQIEQNWKQRQQYKTLLPMLLEQFFFNMMVGGAWGHEEIHRKLQQLGLPIHPDEGKCSIMKAEWSRPDLAARSPERRSEEIHALSVAITKEKDQVYYTCIHLGDNRLLIVAAAMGECTYDEFAKKNEQFFIHIQKSLLSLLGMSIRLDRHKVYPSLRELLHQRDFVEWGVTAADNGLSDLKELAIGVLTMMRDELQESDLEGAIRELREMQEKQPIIEWCRKMFVSVPDKESGSPENERAIIRQAKQYISEQVERGLSLSEVSRYIHLNPVYFSRLFKQETGETFSDYVTGLRMKKAMDYLRDPQYKVYEIGALIGYKNTKYFHKLFKRYTGYTPSEFRGK